MATCIPSTVSGRIGATFRDRGGFVTGGAEHVVMLRVRRPAGSRGRVYARVVFTRPGSKKLRRKTVSRRFVMCS